MQSATTTVARLSCDEPTARRLADHLSEQLDPDDCACAAFEIVSGRWQFEIYFRAPPNETSVRRLIAKAAGDEAAAAMHFESVTAADWVAASLVNLTPVEAGRFVVHGAHDRARIPANRVGIEIEAALAFGTGHHGTTRGCLLALDALSKRRRRSPIPPLKREGRSERSKDRGGVIGRRTNPRAARFARHPPPFRKGDKRSVLDVGTGSGVLAIAAARTCRCKVTATDIDAQAISVARANARLNRAAPFVTFARANGCSARFVRERAPYGLIFANILLPVLKGMAAPLAALAARGGHVVLSGLLTSQVNAALALYQAQGLRFERCIVLDGWGTLVMRKR